MGSPSGKYCYGGYAQRTDIMYRTWKCQARNFWYHLLYWLTTRYKATPLPVYDRHHTYVARNCSLYELKVWET